jgi:Tol biopolymer transport system component
MLSKLRFTWCRWAVAVLLLSAGCVGEDVTITVRVIGSGDGSGFVRADLPEGDIDCRIQAGVRSGTCEEEFQQSGGVGRFFVGAEPDAESGLTDWDGCSDADGLRCTVTFDDPGDNSTRTVTAEFSAAGSILVSVGGAGSGDGRVISTGHPGSAIDCLITAGHPTGPCSATFFDAAQAGSFSLDATANPGFLFGGWTGCSGPATQTRCTFTYPGRTDASFTVAATFHLANTVTVAVDGVGPGDGRVVSTGLPAGATIDCTRRAGVTGGTCTANFTIAVQAGSFSLDATADAGSVFTGWGADCTGTQARCTLNYPGGTSITFSATAGFDLVVSPPPPPPPPPGTDYIAFTSDRDGNNEIYTVTLDGVTVKRLTNDLDADEEPSWSRDGSRIVFDSERDDDPEIYSMKADGTDLKRLTTLKAIDDEPAWSHDGTKIVFESDRGGGLEELWVMLDDGNQPQKLVTIGGQKEDPAWSPDGTRIAFASNVTGDYEVYVINADGTGGLKRLTTSPGDDAEPNWSPDSKSIVFQSERSGNGDIYTMDALDGMNLFRVTTDAAQEGKPSWSPDGDRIAFSAPVNGKSQIFIVNKSGTVRVRLLPTSTSNDDDPSWGRVP